MMAQSRYEHGAGGEAGFQSVAALESLLEQQEALFTKLDELSGSQARLIEGDHTDRLLDVLAARQVVVEEIAVITRRLDPWRSRWSDFVALLDEHQRDRVRQRVDSVAALAQRIAERDEKDRELMEARKESIATTIGQVHRGRGAMAAYGGQRPGDGPRFQDREA
jgi:hypothetical protein